MCMYKISRSFGMINDAEQNGDGSDERFPKPFYFFKQFSLDDLGNHILVGEGTFLFGS